MYLQPIIEECAAITKSKGFSTDQHATQVALIATEVGEALETISAGGNKQDPMLIAYVTTIREATEAFEAYRKKATEYQDTTVVTDQKNLNEELADICIRVFSYVGGNGQTEAFMHALAEKIDTNRARAYRHGKGF